MMHRKIKNVLLMQPVFVALCFSLLHCDRSKNDIYQTIPIGSSLTRNILEKSTQILLTGKELVLVFNNSVDPDYINNHLLFYDSSLKLMAACYLPSVKVDSIKDRVIYGALHGEKDQRKGRFKSDLPEAYRLNLTHENSSGSIGRKSDKLIEKMELSHKYQVTIYVRRSEDPYAGLGIKKDFAANKIFTVPDTLYYTINDIYFDFGYPQNVASTFFYNDKNAMIQDIMIISDRKVLEGFYNRIWFLLNIKNRDKTNARGDPDHLPRLHTNLSTIKARPKSIVLMLLTKGSFHRYIVLC